MRFAPANRPRDWDSVLIYQEHQDHRSVTRFSRVLASFQDRAGLIVVPRFPLVILATTRRVTTNDDARVIGRESRIERARPESEALGRFANHFDRILMAPFITRQVARSPEMSTCPTREVNDPPGLPLPAPSPLSKKVTGKLNRGAYRRSIVAIPVLRDPFARQTIRDNATRERTAQLCDELRCVRSFVTKASAFLHRARRVSRIIAGSAEECPAGDAGLPHSSPADCSDRS